MSTIAEFILAVNGTKPGECIGKCGNMITEADKDHAMCDSCWDTAFAKMRQVRVTFANDNAETLMKPPPSETRTFRKDDPPSDISSGSSGDEELPLKRSPGAWVPPHLRKKPAPVKLERMPPVQYLGPREKYGRGHRLRDGDSSDDEELAAPAPAAKLDIGYDLGLQCDEEFRQKQLLESEDDGFTDYCPGCESGCDADSAHRSGHGGFGYHPDCYMNAVEDNIPPEQDLRQLEQQRIIHKIKSQDDIPTDQRSLKFQQDMVITAKDPRI
jgi:hypothetical protein